MLETPEERIKMLREGIIGKEVERLYLENKCIKLIKTPILFKLVEMDYPENYKNVTACPVAIV